MSAKSEFVVKVNPALLKRAARQILDKTCRCEGADGDPGKCHVCHDLIFRAQYLKACSVCREYWAQRKVEMTTAQVEAELAELGNPTVV